MKKIEIDLHCHSVASTHAYSTVKELAEGARDFGLKGFALTDHAPNMPDSPHIWHFHNLRCLPDEIAGVRVLKGVEANIIDTDGYLDMSAGDLEPLEWVLASFHMPVIRGFTPDEYTNAYIKLAENPWVDSIGHCTTSGFLFDYERVLKIWKEREIFPEINESSLNNRAGALKNTAELLKLCKKYEVPVVVNSDAHYCGIIGVVTEAEKMLDELAFPEELIFNADFDRVMAFIGKKRSVTKFELY